MAHLSDNNKNEAELSERLKFVHEAEEIVNLAVREYSKITGIDEKMIREKMVLRRIDQALNCIEFEYLDTFFSYRK
jgi:hypothetical protein